MKWLRRYFLKKQTHKQNVTGYGEEPDSDGRIPVFVKTKYTEHGKKSMIARKDRSFSEEDVVDEEIRESLFKKRRTKVVDVGEVVAESLNEGDSMSPKGKSWYGTLGFFVKRYMLNSGLFRGTGYLYNAPQWMKNILSKFLTVQVYAVTNRHVVLNEYGDLNSAEQYFVSPKNTKVIGLKLTEVSKDFNIDSAILKVLKQPDIKIKRFGDAKVGMKVEKTGARTYHTTGECIRRNVSMSINFGGTTGVKTLHGLDMFTNMSAPGDSGSAIIEKGTNKVVTLLNAGSSKVTLGIPVKKVLDTMKVEVA